MPISPPRPPRNLRVPGAPVKNRTQDDIHEEELDNAVAQLADLFDEAAVVPAAALAPVAVVPLDFPAASYHSPQASKRGRETCTPAEVHYNAGQKRRRENDALQFQQINGAGIGVAGGVIQQFGLPFFHHEMPGQFPYSPSTDNESHFSDLDSDLDSLDSGVITLDSLDSGMHTPVNNQEPAALPAYFAHLLANIVPHPQVEPGYISSDDEDAVAEMPHYHGQ